SGYAYEPLHPLSHSWTTPHNRTRPMTVTASAVASRLGRYDRTVVIVAAWMPHVHPACGASSCALRLNGQMGIERRRHSATSGQHGYTGTSASCPIELTPAAATPNQRATSLPVKIANDATNSRIPRNSTIQPHVRRSLKTYVLLTP